MCEHIDFVVLWVDGNDPKWLAEKSEYDANICTTENSSNYFRDWNNMKYWFRAVEKFAPWVRKIHFVTCGHLPEFLDVDYPKLNVVKHEDFMPKECLPNYNSAAIEIGLHKIPGIAEHFVYFNDDMFLINKVKPTDFFKKGLPCEEGLEGLVVALGKQDMHCHRVLNNLEIINKYFSKRTQMRKYPLKWFNYRYGLENIRNICLLPWGKFVGFKNSHLPVAFLKSTFEVVWEKEGHVINETLHHRFRSYKDITQYVFRYWQLASGMFYPRAAMGKNFEISEDTLESITKEISKQKHKVICINDTNSNIDFELCRNKINDAFREILGKPSSFERENIKCQK